MWFFVMSKRKSCTFISHVTGMSQNSQSIKDHLGENHTPTYWILFLHLFCCLKATIHQCVVFHLPAPHTITLKSRRLFRRRHKSLELPRLPELKWAQRLTDTPENALHAGRKLLPYKRWNLLDLCKDPIQTCPMYRLTSILYPFQNLGTISNIIISISYP